MRSPLRSVSLPVAGWSLALLVAGVQPGGPTAAEAGEPSEATVRWSDPTNGLAIGLEVPRVPFVFTPTPGWNGQTVIREYDAEGRPTGERENPGGRWDSGAKVVVHLRNTSTNELLWSDYYFIWQVLFTGDGFKDPKTRVGHGPMDDDIRRHKRIPPKGEATIDIPVSRGCRIWPALPEGAYYAAVVYKPIERCHTSTGYSNTLKWFPFREEGFWQGRIMTPTVEIRVQHPK